MTATVTDADSAGDEGSGSSKKSRLRWMLLGFGGVVVVVALIAGIWAWAQYRDLTSAKYNDVAYVVPNAPHLVAGSGERVYRIDPTQSSIGYGVNEKLFGHDTHHAQGTTNGIAGDIALNADQPSQSHAGEIAVNLEQLHSDNNLRDARIRQTGLESHRYPLAYLKGAKFKGLPNTITDGTPYHFTINSQLMVKNYERPVKWDATGTLENGKLTLDATAHVKMSDWHAGPISVAGFVSTSDAVDLTMKVTALDPSKFTIPTSIAAPATAKHGKSPSFKNVVMPALQANCAACHKPGEIGAAHWSLATAADAAKVSDGIGTVVAAKYMPPWPASPTGVALAHSRALDQKTIDAIVNWAKAGGQLDVSGSTPVPPTPGPLPPPPRHDITMQMPDAYAGSLATPNDYRCFVLDPHITEPTYVTGFEVLPDKRSEIHHVQIFHVDQAQADAGLAQSGKDGKPGWSCYGTPALSGGGGGGRSGRHGQRDVRTSGVQKQDTQRRRLPGFNGQEGLFAGWVPGQDPVTFGPKTGVEFFPGDKVILQLHYHYTAPPIPDQTTVTFQTDKPTPDFKPIDIINPIGPVEIPCMAGETAPLCDRSAALADDARLYGPSGSFVEPGLLGLCGKTSDQLAATFHDGVASSSCDYTVPENGTIVGVFGHEHTLGSTFRLTLEPDKPDQKILLDIPKWNFDWQMNYTLAQPIHVTAGQKVRMDCSWDRTLDPNRPPKYIVFAEGTEDEMCFSTYSIVPDNP